MAEYGVGLRWGINHPSPLPQTPWKQLAVAGKPWLKPIYLTNSELLHRKLQREVQVLMPELPAAMVTEV